MEKEPQTEANPKVTVETLLKLKQHEQPSKTFWNHFDRELEKKRLQSIVTCEPLYQRLLHGLRVRFHPTVALGTATAFVLGFFLLVQVDQRKVSAPAAPEGSVLELAETDTNSVIDLPENFTSLAAVTRPPMILSNMETDFGVDVIAPKPQTFRFRAYRTDMEPAQFKVSPEKSLSYLPDSLRLTPSSASRSF